MDWLTDPNVWIALVTLTALEIVLGIDTKGYVYFAMGFSVFVEALNIRLRRRSAKPVHVRTLDEDRASKVKATPAAPD